MTLGLFFTRGISISQWIEKGMLDREIFLYLQYLKNGNIDHLYLFTYGSNDVDVFSTLDYAVEYSGKITIVQAPKLYANKIGHILYSLLLPFIQRKRIKECNFLKSNQMDGSWAIIIASFFYKKPYYIRSGYSKTFFVEKNRGKGMAYYGYYFLEKFVYKSAKLASVSSERERKSLIKNHHLNPDKVKVIPNYIDTKLFKDHHQKRISNRLLFVGRFDSQKNLDNLIKGVAMSNLHLEIDFVGNCSDARKSELNELAKSLEVKINFLGLVRNKELPTIYNQYTYYVLVSLFEGMPKTLIEAMSCGCVCIGTKAPGIEEILEHNENGVVAENCSPEAIAQAIVFSQKADTERISTNASMYIENNFSTTKIMKKELELITYAS
jgi:glycosyltransferase involved in cell wall biosynthesis